MKQIILIHVIAFYPTIVGAALRAVSSITRTHSNRTNGCLMEASPEAWAVAESSASAAAASAAAASAAAASAAAAASSS